MQTHGPCSLLIKSVLRMTHAVVNTGVTRNPNYDPFSPASATGRRSRNMGQVRMQIVHRHNDDNESLI